MKANQWAAMLATGSMLALAAPVTAQFGSFRELTKVMETVANELEQPKPQPTARPTPTQVSAPPPPPSALQSSSEDNLPSLDDKTQADEGYYIFIQTYFAGRQGRQQPRGTVRYGTVSSSEEICKRLSHPIFDLDEGDLQRTFVKSQGIFEIDGGLGGGALLSNWFDMYSRRTIGEPFHAYDTTKRLWVVRSTTIKIVSNYNLCLMKIYNEDPVKYRRISSSFGIDPDIMISDKPCFERSYITKERLNSSGDVEQYQVRDPNRVGCFGALRNLYVADYSIFNIGIIRLALTLNESGKSLNTILDRAYEKASKCRLERSSDGELIITDKVLRDELRARSSGEGCAGRLGEMRDNRRGQ